MTSSTQNETQMAGKEALVGGRLAHFDLMRQRIAAAAAVSFDFFDTLFLRSLLDPEDLFDIIGKRFGIENFSALRRAAQSEAFRRMQKEGRREITFEGIYACFGSLPVPAEALRQAEYEMELALVHPNSELVELFVETVTSGKPVVLTSDMYLPGRFFAEALERHNLPMVPIFVSADKNATKRDTGELFDIVAAELGLEHERILHVGDNPESDVKKAGAKGLATYHYKEIRRPPDLRTVKPEASLARGLLRKHIKHIPEDSFEELGFLYGGPAALGFLDWISEQAKRDGIDHVLFLARDGYILERIAKLRPEGFLPKFDYFLGSRVVFTLAAMNERNFAEFLPFLLSGAEELSPYELLERIDVHPPADKVMEDFHLGAEAVVGRALYDQLRVFMCAYRWEILKICRRNRRALFIYLNKLGLRSGARVALVDIGWNGTTQEAFELAIHDLMDIDVFGYYFCLANTPECKKRQQTRQMNAMLSPTSISADLVERIYKNRVGVELFFSAPHPSVIGLMVSEDGGVEMTEGYVRRSSSNLADISSEIVAGMETFANSYDKLREQLQVPTSPVDLAMPLIDFITDENWHSHQLLGAINNFDCWSRTKNRNAPLASY